MSGIKMNAHVLIPGQDIILQNGEESIRISFNDLAAFIWINEVDNRLKDYRKAKMEKTGVSHIADGLKL